MLISEEYRQLNKELHETNELYGIMGGAATTVANVVQEFAQQLETTDVLDYGCGKGMLAKAMPYPIKEYDPAIPGKENGNIPADIVICIDVLEHVEPTCVAEVITDLHRCTLKLCVLAVDCMPAKKHLPDGRNVHLMLERPDWWWDQLKPYFKCVAAQYIHAEDPGCVVQFTLVPIR